MPSRIPPVGAAAAGVMPVSAFSGLSPEKSAEKLKKLKEMHAAQAHGVNVKVQRRPPAAAVHPRHGHSNGHAGQNRPATSSTSSDKPKNGGSAPAST